MKATVASYLPCAKTSRLLNIPLLYPRKAFTEAFNDPGSAWGRLASPSLLRRLSDGC